MTDKLTPEELVEELKSPKPGVTRDVKRELLEELQGIQQDLSSEAYTLGTSDAYRQFFSKDLYEDIVRQCDLISDAIANLDYLIEEELDVLDELDNNSH